MPKLPHQCLIVVCLAGSLLLLPHSCVGQDDLVYDYDSTPVPEYDYNATFDYSFFSNGSSEDLDRLLVEKADEEIGTESTPQTDTVSPTKNQASRTVYPSLLLTVVLTAHQILRFL